MNQTLEMILSTNVVLRKLSLEEQEGIQAMHFMNGRLKAGRLGPALELKEIWKVFNQNPNRLLFPQGATSTEECFVSGEYDDLASLCCFLCSRSTSTASETEILSKFPKMYDETDNKPLLRAYTRVTPALEHLGITWKEMSDSVLFLSFIVPVNLSQRCTGVMGIYYGVKLSTIIPRYLFVLNKRKDQKEDDDSIIIEDKQQSKTAQTQRETQEQQQEMLINRDPRLNDPADGLFKLLRSFLVSMDELEHEDKIPHSLSNSNQQ